MFGLIGLIIGIYNYYRCLRLINLLEKLNDKLNKELQNNTSSLNLYNRLLDDRINGIYDDLLQYKKKEVVCDGESIHSDDFSDISLN